MVAPAGFVLLDNLTDRIAVEPAGLEHRTAEQFVAHALTQRPAEPARQRHGKAHLRPVHDVVRQMRLHRLLEQELALAAPDLQRGREGRQPFDQRVVHQRLAHFERVRHAGAIDLGVDVADQVGVQVDVLDQRKRIVGVRPRRMPFEDLLGAVAAELRLEAVTENLVALPVADDGHAVEVGLDRIARQCLEGRLGPKHARRPVGLGIESAEHAEKRPAQTERQRGAHLLFHQMQGIAPITPEAFVAAIAGQGDGDMPPRELANAIGGDRRAVGIGFVVKLRQRVDQIEVVALDPVNEVPGLVAIGNLLRKTGLVVGRIGERNRAGIDRLGRQAGHHRHHGAGIDAAGKEGAERHLGNHAQADRLGEAPFELMAGLLDTQLLVQAEAHVPILARRG